ncbi:MAG: hypothetical protein U1F09_15740 [Steroidobacteraceae bacterium]
MTPSQPRPYTWLLVALAPLLATGATLGDSLALAVTLPLVAVACALAARALPRGTVRSAVAVIVGTALVVAATDLLAAVMPGLGDGPARWLPIAVVVGIWLGCDDGDTVTNALPQAFAAGALALVLLAVGREVAARVSPVVLTPAGAFIAIGASLALVTAIENRRHGTRAPHGPTP